MAMINNHVVGRRPRKNNFNLSSERLMTGKIGLLHVIDRFPVVPGDRFDDKVSFIMRFAPLVAPAMVRMNVHIHAFFVPNRIITPSNSQSSVWENFIEKTGHAEEDIPELPTISGNIDLSYLEDSWGDYGYSLGEGKINGEQVAIGSLWDDLGLPTVSLSDISKSIQGNPNDNMFWRIEGLSALPFLGYQKIYTDFYRRDQIESPLSLLLDAKTYLLHDIDNLPGLEDAQADAEGAIPIDAFELLQLRTRNYERDYFTSALPDPQFGEDVIIGDGSIDIASGQRGIIHTGATSIFGISAVQPSEGDLDNIIMDNSGYIRPDSYAGSDMNIFGFGHAPQSPELGSFEGIRVTGIEGLTANTFTVNELRLAMQLQGVREKINRGGTRYLEIMKSIYGVTVPDARLQRPQFLGGCSFPVTIGEVVQTSETSTTPQGNLSGKAISVGGNTIFRNKREFVEHGQIYVIMSVTPRTSYMGGIPRDFMNRYPQDFYVPDFDHLGEDIIFDSELYRKMLFKEDEEPTALRTEFGYTPRYSFLKQGHSTATGDFRDGLDTWVTTREFTTSPNLNKDFIKAEPEDFDRLFVFQDVPGISNAHFRAQFVFKKTGKRPMSKYSTPYTFY